MDFILLSILFVRYLNFYTECVIYKTQGEGLYEFSKYGYGRVNLSNIRERGREKPSSERERDNRQASFPSAQVRGKIITGHHGSGLLPPKYN